MYENTREHGINCWKALQTPDKLSVTKCKIFQVIIMHYELMNLFIDLSVLLIFSIENVEETNPGVMTIATTSQSSLSVFGVEWDTSRLMHVETVDVVVYGYREDTSDSLVFLENILTLAENISYQAGSTNVTLSSTDTTYEVGVFAVLEHQDEALPNNR